MMRKVRSSLSAILADAQERGLVGQNVVRVLRARRRAARRPAPTNARRASSRSASTSRRLTRFAPSSTSRRPLAAVAVDCDLHRPARLRAARLALERRRFARAAIARPAARRLLQHDRPTEVRIRRAHRPAAADAGQHIARTPARLPQGSARSRLSQRRWQRREPSNIVQRGLKPGLDRSGCCHGSRQAEISRPARSPAFLRELVHQSPHRRRASNCRSSWFRPAGARFDHDDGGCYGHLFPRGDDRAELTAAEKAFWEARLAMIRIAITLAAYDARIATLPNLSKNAHDGIVAAKSTLIRRNVG